MGISLHTVAVPQGLVNEGDSKISLSKKMQFREESVVDYV